MLATDRQKARLKELDIDFDDDITRDEAAQLLRPHAKPVEIKLNINANAMVEMSELKVGEI